MPILFAQPQLLGVLALGTVGAALSAAGAYFLASWKKRARAPYALSAFVFYALVFIATFTHSVVNSSIAPDAAHWLFTVLILGQAAVTMVGVAIFTLLIFGAYLLFLGELDFPVSRVKSYLGCAFFCFTFAVFFNPSAAVRHSDRLAAPSLYQAALAGGGPEVVAAARREAARTLESLRAIGALTQIDVTATALIHHVKGQFIDLPNAVVEEYMRAALIHHIYDEGGKLKPVVLREAGSDREIARRETNGRFRRHAAVALPQGELPPGG